jgi:dTDP-4-dehydrorhamnose 3,5-epimerase
VEGCRAVARFETLPTRLDGPLLIAAAVHGDDRGFFSETYRANDFADLGVAETMVQDNHSRSRYGTIRGMHFHIGAGCSKLVRCGRGSIVDVLVDLRKDSPTFGQHEAYELTEENAHVLYAPIGFGHGFAVTSEVADVLYKQSAYYAPDVERGISFMDPALAIDWPVPRADWVYSERDSGAPTLAEFGGL